MQTPSKRLTREYVDVDLTSMTDRLTVIAANIENALLQIGATPIQDYTYRDLMGWAISVLMAPSEGNTGDLALGPK